jgi:predicted amidohydrolase
MEIIVGLWSRKTVSAHAMQNAQIKMQQLQAAVQRLAQEAARRNIPAKQQVKSIFVAPEYYFAKRESAEALVYDIDPSIAAARSLEEKQKDLLLKHLQRISKQHKGMLIIPGTIAWKKKLSKSIRRKAKRVLDVIGARYGDDLRGGGVESPDMARRMSLVSHGVAPRLVRIPTVPDIAAKQASLDDSDYKFMMRNTAFVLLDGKVMVKYHKIGDFHEAINDDETVFIPGVKAVSIKIGPLFFGFEICLDHGISILQRALAPTDTIPDIHIISSASVAPDTNHMHVKLNGYCLHASDNDAYSGVWFRSPTVGFTRTGSYGQDTVSGDTMRFYTITPQG